MERNKKKRFVKRVKMKTKVARRLRVAVQGAEVCCMSRDCAFLALYVDRVRETQCARVCCARGHLSPRHAWFALTRARLRWAQARSLLPDFESPRCSSSFLLPLAVIALEQQVESGSAGR